MTSLNEFKALVEIYWGFKFLKGAYMIKRYKKWKKWRRRNINGRFYQFLILIGLMHSPSFEYWYR